MPKMPDADKKTPARNARPGRGFRKTRSPAPASINELLAGRPGLAALAARLPAQRAWTEWLRAALPPDLAAHVVNVVPKTVSARTGAQELVVLADSSAWCARLRYALAGLEPSIGARNAAVQRTRVRVSPGG
jgi:hypothetical protein